MLSIIIIPWMQLIPLHQFTYTDSTAAFVKLVEDNVNSCSAVVRANACAVREIVLKKPCDVTSSS